MTFSSAARPALLACAVAAGLLLASVSPTRARAQASESPPDTARLRLDALLAEVEAANPALRAARLEAAARAQRRAQVGALPDPTASVTVSPYPILTARGAQRTQWRVEQAVPWPGTLGLRAEVADRDAAVAAHEAEALALDLALAVKSAYYTLYRVERTDSLTRAFAERLRAFAEAAVTRYEVGRGPQGAVLQVRLEEDRLAERLLTLDAQREAARQTLARLTDRPELVLTEALTVEPPPLPASDAALGAAALRLRPEVEALEAAAERADAEVALARKAFYPDVGLGVVYTDIAPRDMPPTADGRDALAIMASVRLPLQRGRLRAALEEARLRRTQVEARREALEAEIRTELAELVHHTHRAAEALALYRERLLPQAQATVESVLAAYTTGAADYAAYLDAERTRFGVQLGLEEALGRYLDAAARLERALGASLTDLRDDVRRGVVPSRSDTPRR